MDGEYDDMPSLEYDSMPSLISEDDSDNESSSSSLRIWADAIGQTLAWLEMTDTETEVGSDKSSTGSLADIEEVN